MKRIIGLDLSLTATGIATPDLVGTIKSKFRGPRRLVEIRADILEHCTRDDIAVIEGYAFGRHNQAAHLGELGGVVRVALYEAGVRILTVPPASLKRYATGKGNASKEDVLAAAIRRLGYQGSSTDEADALWLRQIGLAKYAPDDAVNVPAENRAALEKIAWEAA